tara:strand:+ start:542 stop:670 length:129 start_codon:yes stop_codon:yes gene_type:complete
MLRSIEALDIRSSKPKKTTVIIKPSIKTDVNQMISFIFNGNF